MLPEEELETDLHDTYAQQRSRANPLIVVASLIDKIPNLGGEFWGIDIGSRFGQI